MASHSLTLSLTLSSSSFCPYKSGFNFSYPQSITAVRGREDWDTVSLESSEFDETSSVDSALFPLLAREEKRERAHEVITVDDDVVLLLWMGSV